MNLNATADFLGKNGERIALRRLTGPGLYFEVICQARVLTFTPDEMTGGIVQGDRKVILSNSEIEAGKWPGPPRAGDQVILLDQGGVSAMVKAAYPSSLYGAVVRHTLQIRGS